MTCTSAPAVPCALDSTNCQPIDSESNCVEQNDEVTTEDLAELRSDLHDSLDELMQSLREEVFVDENLESDDGKTVVYKLGPKSLCDLALLPIAPSSGAEEGTVTIDSPSNEPEYDADCVAELAKWTPRLQLVSPREGDIDLSLLLTDQRISPITLNLYQQKLGVTVDLAKVEAASARAGTPMDGVSSLAGVFSASLVQNANLDYSLGLSVTDMVKMVLGETPNTVSITLAPSPKALTLNVNGNTGRISGQLNLSSFKMSGPLSSFTSEDDEVYDTGSTSGSDTASIAITEPSYHGTIEAYLAGVSGSFTHEQANDSLSFTNIGFGTEPSTVKFDQSTLISMDVNAQSGRVFDLYIDGSSDTGPSLQFSPGLDVDVLLGFAAIADQIEDIEQFLLSDRLKLSLKGNQPTLRVEQEQIRVLTGTLDLSSLSYPDLHHSITADLCLVDSEVVETPPSILGELASQTCQ
ncbi:MAG TPA: hypothetical protein VKP30_33425 [Polyangiaceae bacterium]|nr:hypothetical protein [Polyangiaceae bacterium]